MCATVVLFEIFQTTTEPSFGLGLDPAGLKVLPLIRQGLPAKPPETFHSKSTGLAADDGLRPGGERRQVEVLRLGGVVGERLVGRRGTA